MVVEMDQGIQKMVRLGLDDDIDLIDIQKSLKNLPLEADEDFHVGSPNSRPLFSQNRTLFSPDQPTPPPSTWLPSSAQFTPDSSSPFSPFYPPSSPLSSSPPKPGTARDSVYAPSAASAAAHQHGLHGYMHFPHPLYPSGTPSPPSHPSSLPSPHSHSHSTHAHLQQQQQHQRPYKSIPPQGYVCKLCKVPGHWIQSCPDAALYPLVRDPSLPPRKLTYPPDGYICRLCGIAGHWIQNCPDAPQFPPRSEPGKGEYGNGRDLTSDSDRRTPPLSPPSPSAATPSFHSQDSDVTLLEESSTLWMGDLESWMTEETLTHYFSRFGEAVKVRIATFKYGVPAGYCYIYFSSPKTAHDVFEKLNGQLMEGTNHVFRLKIANKASRFFSRASKEHRPFFASKGDQQLPSFPSHQPLEPSLPLSLSPSPSLQHQQQQEEPHYMEERFSFEEHPEMYDTFHPDVGRFGPRGPSFSVFVGNLGLDVDRETLLSVFQKRYQSVIGGKVVFDPFTGISKGYGFVIFADEAEQSRALREMQGEFCRERPLRIHRAVRRSFS